MHVVIVHIPFFRFQTKSNGVLYENDLLQIGVKSEYKKNLGRPEGPVCDGCPCEGRSSHTCMLT